MYTDPLRDYVAKKRPRTLDRGFRHLMTMLRAKGEAEPAMWSQKVQKKSAESQNFRSPAGFQGNFLIGGHLKISEGGHGVSVKNPNFSD